MSLDRRIAPLGPPGMYFLISVHPSNPECVDSLHTLQGNRHLFSGVFFFSGVGFLVLLPDSCFSWSRLFFALLWVLLVVFFYVSFLDCSLFNINW